jgi:hypothetical protein
MALWVKGKLDKKGPKTLTAKGDDTAGLNRILGPMHGTRDRSRISTVGASRNSAACPCVAPLITTIQTPDAQARDVLRDPHTW